MSVSIDILEKVDLYLLQTSHTDARIELIVKLIHKCHQQKLKALIVTDNVAWLKSIDEALWSLLPNNFIAHERFESDTCAPFPNVLFVTFEQLIAVKQLGFEPDVCFDELSVCELLDYPRIILVSDQDAVSLTLGRKKYQQYQQAGVVPDLHRLKG